MKMQGIFLRLAMVVLAATLLVPAAALADGTGAFNKTAVALDERTFITVKDTVTGEIISLYRVEGEQIRLLDVVLATKDRDPKESTRYLHHEDVENR